MSAAALVMARAPRPGTAMPGLAPLLGPDGCAVLEARLVARAARLAAEAAPGAAFVAVDPAEDAELLHDLVGTGVEVFGQYGAGVGERLAASCARVFEQAGRYRPLVLVGTDAPTVGRAHFAAALEMLAGGRDVAVGPSLDGGWYLIALARPVPELFALPAGAWGGDRVLGLTLRAARGAGLRVGLIEPARRLASPADARALLEEGELPEEVAELLRVPAEQ